MHLYRLETIGNLDGLGAREEAIPVPSAGEVLIRVKASALNFRDLAILLGKSPFPVRPGVVPISDAAGEVEAYGRLRMTEGAPIGFVVRNTVRS